MDQNSSVMHILLDSIHNRDLIILITAIVTLFLFILTVTMSKAVSKRGNAWKNRRNRPFSEFVLKWLSLLYSVFTTLIGVFPLLGMLGTVFGLLSLDFTSGIDNMESIKGSFFMALTSTAWGIIFSIFFKVLHGLIADSVEANIELAKKLSENDMRE